MLDTLFLIADVAGGLDTLFLIAAVVGGTVMVCQFLLTMLGLGDDGSDIGDGDVGGDVGDFDAGADAGGDFDVDGDHHTAIHHAADADVDHPGSTWLFQMLSFRTVVAALTFFGLGGAWSSSSGHGSAQALGIGVLAGGAAMYGMYRLMRAIYDLQSSGNVDIRNAVGKPAKIYIPVPPVGTGKGKIQITLQGRTMEYEAVSDAAETLSTGENVVVENVVGSDIVKVMRA
jgi:hypothetical protein